MPKRPAARGTRSGPPAYEELDSCTYLGRPRISLTHDEVPVCQCKPRCEGGSGCGDDCQNRHTNHECHPDYCPCGLECQNQQIQRHNFVQTRLQHMGNKGWGLVTTQAVEAGSFVMEYVGEVVSADQASVRSAAYHTEQQPHTYFMNLSSHEVIDATCKGNRARFINHSCQPNCETQKWAIDGETSVCIFALRDIAVGEELTYNYHLQWGGGKRIRCQCGAAKCQGFLEADSAQNRAAMLMDADADDAGYSLVDPCLETYDSDQDPIFPSADMALSSARLSQSLLQQAAAATAAGPGRSRSQLSHTAQHAAVVMKLGSDRLCTYSPDSSATLTGSGPCSDASDLTSSHPSDLPKQHHKRIKLGSTPGAQLAISQHAPAQCAPDPNLEPLAGAGEGTAQRPGQQGLHGAALHSHQPSDSALLPTSSTAVQLQGQAVEDSEAPPYVPCVIPGLSSEQQRAKAQEEQQLAEALRRQQSVMVAGYEMDASGRLRVPSKKKYTRTMSMKAVFVQRWKHQAQAAKPPADATQLSMKQLLLDEAIQLELEQALPGNATLQHGAVQVPGTSGIAKLPMRFKLSEVKNAMRKAELGGPELSSTSSGNHTPTASDDRHTAWQVQQLSNAPLLNNAWVEFYIDRFNADFDISYWSMLEHLSAGTE